MENVWSGPLRWDFLSDNKQKTTAESEKTTECKEIADRSETRKREARARRATALYVKTERERSRCLLRRRCKKRPLKDPK